MLYWEDRVQMDHASLLEGWIFESSIQLIPGDLIKIESNTKIPCDCIIIKGSCLVNEALLTGEAVPVRKSEIHLENVKDKSGYLLSNISTMSASSNKLFAGTNVAYTFNKECIAFVTGTSFNTMKGKLALQILYTNEQRFKFFEDSLKYITIIGTITMISILVYIPRFVHYNISTKEIIYKVLNVITVSVPPVLILSMNVGIEIALGRLRKLGVKCIHPNKINTAGKINTIVFDKTGTLTKNDFTFTGFVPKEKFNSSFQRVMSKESGYETLRTAFGVCHSVCLAKDQLIGDSMEIEMFKASAFSMNLDAAGDYYFQDERKKLIGEKFFEFEPNLQMMTVVASVEDSKTGIKIMAFTKGAPEKMLEKCLSESIPFNHNEVLHNLTNQGYRVLSIAYKEIPSNNTNLQALTREETEVKLSFIGFLILENSLKESTVESIDGLHKANITTYMSTGDFQLTAIHVGYSSHILNSNSYTLHLEYSDENRIKITPYSENGILDQNFVQKVKNLENQIPENMRDALKMLNNEITNNFSTQEINLSISGDFFRFLTRSYDTNNVESMEILRTFLYSIKIYSRMKPKDKGTLIEWMIHDKRFVAMCGDGANDTLALQKADVGISLSDEESSLAASFTSYHSKDISITNKIFLHGRSALSSSLMTFKFITIYALTQFVSVYLNYFYLTDMTQYQYLYVDFYMLIPLLFSMNQGREAESLTKEIPLHQLVSLEVLSSILLGVLAAFIFQFWALYYIVHQSFYVSFLILIKRIPDGVETDEAFSYEKQMTYQFSFLQYLIFAFVYYQGKPFRRTIFDNKLFIGLLAFFIIIHLVFFVFFPPPFVKDIFKLKDFPSYVYFFIIGITIVNFITYYGAEILREKLVMRRRLKQD